MVIISRAFKFDSGRDRPGTYTEPDQCPLCKHAIKPQELDISTYSDNSNTYYLSGHYLCKNCYQTFVSLSSCTLSDDRYKSSYTSELLYCGPTHYEEMMFSDALCAMSPKFVKIYNQALAAETSGLDEICGIGYRKSLEFLIKDYLIHRDPDSRETIEKMELGNCIANKISDDDLKAVASRCAWLGNDETHYFRRFEEYDLTKLKQLLEATIFWVSMKLTTEMATSIEKRR